MFIKGVRPKIIKNSRGERTIEIEVSTDRGRFKASAPSGKSKGKHEVEYYSSKGIEWSLRMIKAFSKRLVNKNFLIRNLDGLKEFETEIKKFEAKYGRFGGNCVFALETAFLKAAAYEKKKQLWKFIFDSIFDETKKKVHMPMPVGNCIGGGLHSRGLDQSEKPDFQEFLLIPNPNKEKTFLKAITKNIHAYEKARRLLKKKHGFGRTRVNDEHALMSKLDNKETLIILKQVAKEYGLRIGLDIAASSFFEEGYYKYKNKEIIRDRLEQIEYIQRIVEKYGLYYVEDPMNEEDFAGFAYLTRKLGKQGKTLIVGDDLTTTNKRRVDRAIKAKSMNAIIIKPNQIGSLIEVKRVVGVCKNQGIKIIFSHRSGETMDDALADFAVGFQADFIKSGILGRERLIKLRRVVEIEKSLGV